MASTTPPRKFKIGLIQTKPKPNDPEFNFQHAASQIRHTASQGASLTILPEYHLTAFDPESEDFIPACQTSHPYVAKYQALAKELAICIVPGTIVLTPEPEDPTVIKYTDGVATDGSGRTPVLLNTAFFIDDKGEILSQYTKTNLWHPERPHLTSSIEHHENTRAQTNSHLKPSSHAESLPEPHNAFDSPLGKIGMLVCWDLAFPEAFRSLLLQGAEIILVPTYWLFSDMSPEGLALNPEAEKLFLQTTIVSRSYENTSAIVFCNAGGPADEGFIGISQVALPIVGVLEGSFKDSEEGVRVVEVDMNIVKVAEDNYKVRADLSSENWHYGYTR